jgi:P-type Cu2+ transporter
METITKTPPINPSDLTKIPLDVSGMKCAGCVQVVEQELNQYPGVKSATVNLITQVAIVEYETDQVNPDKLANILTDAGFPTQVRKGNEEGNNLIDKQKEETKEMRKQLILASLLLIISLIAHLGQGSNFHIQGLDNIWLHWGLATLAILIPGKDIIKDGWLGVKRQAPNMNTLVGLGTISAYTASCIALIFPQLGWECFFDEPVMLLGFILLGRTLEHEAKKRAAQAFTQLLALQPKLARLIINPQDLHSDTSSADIPVNQVKIGELLRVLPGDKIPVDGVIISGETTINQSMLTGESLPVYKTISDEVSAGTINQTGVIIIETLRVGKDTTLAQIVTYVENAQARKAPIQKIADLIAGYFTYGVLTIAGLTFIFWDFFGTKIWPHVLHHTTHHLHDINPEQSPLLLSIKLAIAVLVIACPCALGLATPTAILVGTGKGAEQGLLIKGGDSLEKIQAIDTIIFDKTGTLTTGKPTITDCIVFNSTEQNLVKNSQDLIKISAAVETGTNHPLATAIIDTAKKLNVSLPTAKDFQSIIGKGVTATIENQKIILSNVKYLQELGIIITTEQQQQGKKISQEGKTIVYIAINQILTGLIAIKDEPQPQAKTVINTLKSMGLETIMMTGDSQETAIAIAKQIDIKPTQAIANLSPIEKAEIILKMQKEGHKIAMIGDGINDAPAMAQADVAIAVYNGTEVARSTADIVLMRDRLTDVIASIKLSQQTFTKIRQNLFWAFAYNILCIPIAAGVLLPQWGIVLNPAVAGGLMAFSSISVVTNSLLLRKE